MGELRFYMHQEQEKPKGCKQRRPACHNEDPVWPKFKKAGAPRESSQVLRNERRGTAPPSVYLLGLCRGQLCCRLTLSKLIDFHPSPPIRDGVSE